MKDGENGDENKNTNPTPLLDELEGGSWPSFVTGLKRLRDNADAQYAPMMNDLLGQLNHSYENRKGYWKGGTVSVYDTEAALSRAFPKCPKNSQSLRNFILYG